MNGRRNSFGAWIKTFLRACVAISFGVANAGSAQLDESQIPTTAPTPPISVTRPAFNILRYNEDWSVLRDPALRTDWLDPVKYIPLSRSHPDRFLTVGGEFRGTYEHVLNDSFTQQPFPNFSFGMQRFQLFTDIHVAQQLRMFVQLESGLEQGRSGGPRPIDEKKLDFLNAFVDVRLSTRSGMPRLRIGRQELNYGSGRFVAVREGPNIRQGFYGIAVHSDLRKWSLDGFAVRPAQDNKGFFDNVPLHTSEFWGFFATRTLSAEQEKSLDVYYLGLDRKSATFQSGSARELRQTIGSRIVSAAPKTRSFRPHYDVEAAMQFGSFGARSIRAWTVSGEFGYALNSTLLKARPGLRADISSGDAGDPSRSLGTFNPLFPIGNYFGVLSDTGPGPVNFRDLHPDVRLALSKTVSADADWIVYWRQSLHDGIYTVPGGLLTPVPSTSTSRFVGHRPGLEIRWQLTAHAYIQADYGLFFAGQVLRDAGRPHSLNYASAWVGYKF